MLFYPEQWEIKMSFLGWIIVFFFILVFLVLLVYTVVVKAFYWGDKKEPPMRKGMGKSEKGKD